MERCLFSDNNDKTIIVDYLPLKCYRCKGLDTDCKDFYNGQPKADVIEVDFGPKTPDQMYQTN